ncbi:unnamed protein product [Phytophthora lilii]|uniref:RxLR effector protein n=1 Tax=Phytophthora lilii TaxID=2077276 RepID=A0A9W6U4M6_9STRA|nr:unnamed protein product [Phytophthora lilii]
MRLACSLFVITVTLLASGPAISKGAVSIDNAMISTAAYGAGDDYEKRSLRSVGADDQNAATKIDEEERGFNFNWLDDIIDPKNAEQLHQRADKEENIEFAKNLAKSKTFREKLYPSWQGGMQSTDDVPTILQGLGIHSEALEKQVKAEFLQYLKTHRRPR